VRKMRITEHVHAIKIPFKIQIAPGRTMDRFVYVYAIVGDKVMLLDTGVSGSAEKIFEYLKTIGKNPKDIKMVLLSHSHPDHIGSLATIKKETGCVVAAHSGEKDWIEDVALQCRMRPVPGFNSFVEGSVKVDRLIQDMERIEVEKGITLTAIYTPGHSDGSLSFYFEQEKILFCGDAVLLPGQMPVYENIKDSIASVKKLNKINDPFFILSSWDDPRGKDVAAGLLGASIDYLTNIDQAVQSCTQTMGIADPMRLCETVLQKLGLPDTMANPLTARSFVGADKMSKK